MTEADEVPIAAHHRRRAVRRLTAFIILAVALAALGHSPRTEERSGPFTAPPPGAAYRPDGGQFLSPGGTLKPNALTGLNLGRRIDTLSTPAAHLAALPALGRNTAVKAAASGCLTDRQRAVLSDLIQEKETCVPTSP